MLKILKNRKVITFDGMFLMYPMHKVTQGVVWQIWCASVRLLHAHVYVCFGVHVHECVASCTLVCPSVCARLCALTVAHRQAR